MVECPICFSLSSFFSICSLLHLHYQNIFILLSFCICLQCHFFSFVSSSSSSSSFSSIFFFYLFLLCPSSCVVSSSYSTTTRTFLLLLIVCLNILLFPKVKTAFLFRPQSTYLPPPVQKSINDLISLYLYPDLWSFTPQILGTVPVSIKDKSYQTVCLFITGSI